MPRHCDILCVVSPVVVYGYMLHVSDLKFAFGGGGVFVAELVGIVSLSSLSSWSSSLWSLSLLSLLSLLSFSLSLWSSSLLYLFPR